VIGAARTGKTILARKAYVNIGKNFTILATVRDVITNLVYLPIEPDPANLGRGGVPAARSASAALSSDCTINP
jgi:hypothetical protein